MSNNEEVKSARKAFMGRPKPHVSVVDHQEVNFDVATYHTARNYLWEEIVALRR